MKVAVKIRAYLRRKRRRANASIIRYLAEKRLRTCMILYRSAPQGLALILLLTAFLPSSIRSAIAGVHGDGGGFFGLLSHVNFYLNFMAKGLAILGASYFLRNRILKTAESSDRLLQRAGIRNGGQQPREYQ